MITMCKLNALELLYIIVLQAITLLLHSTVPLTILVFVGHVNKQKSKLLIDATCKLLHFIVYFQ